MVKNTWLSGIRKCHWKFSAMCVNGKAMQNGPVYYNESGWRNLLVDHAVLWVTGTTWAYKWHSSWGTTKLWTQWGLGLNLWFSQRFPNFKLDKLAAIPQVYVRFHLHLLSYFQFCLFFQVSARDPLFYRYVHTIVPVSSLLRIATRLILNICNIWNL